MPVNAALHLHSTWSDGEMTLAEIRELVEKDGCRVACMADHADDFDEAGAAEYVAECRSLSDAGFLFVPGLEFSCAGRMHIIGYGATEPVGSDSPEVVIARIAALGGISVLAHPAPEHLGAVPGFPLLPDGIEAWNTKYDGPIAPRPEVFELVVRMQARKPDLRAFYGLDLHWRRQPRPIHIELGVDAPDEASVLRALREGAFTAVHGSLRLPSHGRITEDAADRFRAGNARSMRRRSWVRRLKKWSGPLGRSLPGPLKSHLRRFF